MDGRGESALLESKWTETSFFIGVLNMFPFITINKTIRVILMVNFIFKPVFSSCNIAYCIWEYGRGR